MMMMMMAMHLTGVSHGRISAVSHGGTTPIPVATTTVHGRLTIVHIWRATNDVVTIEVNVRGSL